MALSKKTDIKSFVKSDIESYLDFFDKNSLEEFFISENGINFTLKRDADKSSVVRQPAVPNAPAPVAEDSGTQKQTAMETAATEGMEEAAELSAKYQEIKSPITGTFYGAPSPDDPPFVKPGDSVTPDQVVCIVEAMKVMNHVAAKVSGKVVKVLPESGEALSKDQTIMYIE